MNTSWVYWLPIVPLSIGAFVSSFSCCPIQGNEKFHILHMSLLTFRMYISCYKPTVSLVGANATTVAHRLSISFSYIDGDETKWNLIEIFSGRKKVKWSSKMCLSSTRYWTRKFDVGFYMVHEYRRASEHFTSLHRALLWPYVFWHTYASYID